MNWLYYSFVVIIVGIVEVGFFLFGGYFFLWKNFNILYKFLKVLVWNCKNLDCKMIYRCNVYGCFNSFNIVWFGFDLIRFNINFYEKFLIWCYL